MDEKTQYKILQRKDANFFLAMGGWGWVMGDDGRVGSWNAGI